MNEKVIIDGKYCGFLGRGNGGYVCGMAAAYIEGTAEVTLWNPPLVDVPFDVELIDGRTLFKHGDVVVAEARSCSLDLDIPRPPTYEQAVEASKLSVALSDNPPSPDCFVCGCNRTKDDGLRIFAGPTQDNNVVAAPWVPQSSLADDSGKIKKEFLWAVLDCPGAYSYFDRRIPIIVLGRLAASVKNNIRPGEKCVVIGWKIGTEGKKLFSGSALFSESGELCGISKATWLPMKGV
ncbi:MAG: hypothetical protein SVY10_00305 [Thermodesulfobacteriota bacterium]|nr:hypothetical protein [Thermodesulfobacteriota bacterium]